jgi:UDP-N-acetylglucosamine--N-acetylmuramyl-(pentapeptide) pyrophosphoryl-undecaprenol N-acetylglucosamine transferase
MINMSFKPVLIIAGGTGGHVYPALAVAEYLREQGIQLFWLGTKAGLESRVVPENNIQLFTISVSGLRGKKFSRWLISPFTLVWALIQSLQVILNLRPSAVIGMGGYVSGPGGIAAWLLRIPLFIHEQNSIAGLTNRLLSPFARTIMQGFPGTMHGSKVVTTGNPVRKDILHSAIPPVDRLAGRQKLPLRLLVLGGSLGAKVLNEMLPRVVNGLPEGVDVDIWHQTGRIHIDSTKSLYKKYRINSGRIVAYIENMAEAYLWADIILCRAGALTISEISIMGVASILVPYPFAVDDHQLKNAEYLSNMGGAVLIPQSEIDDSAIIKLICGFYKDRDALVQMAALSRQRALPNATRDIGNICLEAIYV